MPNVLLTKKGMDFILSAHNAGVFIDLEYFVPVYDDRIDPTIRDPSVLSAYSDIADKNLTAPIGEIIWNQTGYSLDSTGKFIISAAPYSSPLMQNSYQKGITLTNFRGSNPLSNQISANSWKTSGGSINGLYNWEGIGNPIYGVNNPPSSFISASCWKCSDYYPVYDTSATSALRGSFKCVIENTKGTFKFNKIALYAIAYQDGNPTGDACFFGEAYLGTPAVVSNMAIGYDRFEYDIQIDVSGVSASFEDIFFSSSADYWSHSPGGLYWPGMIGVGEFVDNQKAISATVHARKARNASGSIDVKIPVIRLDYDNNRYVSIDVDGNRYDVTKLYSGQLSGTDVIIKVANWTKYCGNAISIHPDVKATVALGTPAKPFRELYLENSDLEENITRNRDNIIPLNVINKKRNYAASFNNGSIYIGLNRTDVSKDTNYFGIRLSAIGLEINDDLEALPNKGLLGNFKGGDLLRDGQNLLIYNTWCSTRPAPNRGVENIYIFAGLNGDAPYTSIDGQVGATHKNIIYEIEQANPGLFCVGNTKLSNLSELHLAAKGKIGLYGPIELKNIRADSYNTSIILTKAEDSRNVGGGLYGDFRLVIAAGVKKNVSLSTFFERADQISKDLQGVNYSDLLENPSSLTGVDKGKYSQIHLVATNILIEGSLLPIQDSYTSLGSTSKRFSQVFSNVIYAGDPLLENGLRLGYIENGDISYDIGGGKIIYGIVKLNINKKVQIGSSLLPIDQSYFKYLTAFRLDAGSYNQTYGVRLGNIGTGEDGGIIFGISKLGTLGAQIGQSSNPFDYGFFKNVLATNGYFEKDRNMPIGHWTSVSIPYQTVKFSYKDIFYDQKNINGVVSYYNVGENESNFKPDINSQWYETRDFKFEKSYPHITVKYSRIGSTTFIRIEAELINIFHSRFFTSGVNWGVHGGPEVLLIPAFNNYLPFGNNSGLYVTIYTNINAFVRHIGEGIIIRNDGYTQNVELLWMTPDTTNRKSYIVIYATSKNDTLYSGQLIASGFLETTY